MMGTGDDWIGTIRSFCGNIPLMRRYMKEVPGKTFMKRLLNI